MSYYEEVLRHAAKDREYADGLSAHINAGGTASPSNVSDMIAMIRWLSDRLASALEQGRREGRFALGDRVTKTKGSSWTGRVVGFYSTSLTPIGYAIESENEPGSVQIYPESAIRALNGEG